MNDVPIRPTRRTTTAVPALVMLACAAAACTSTDATEPPPEEPSGGAEASAIAQLPNRPDELPVDELDPCLLFTEDALRSLSIARKPQPGTADGLRNCALHQDKDPMYDLLVTAYPDAGVESWISGRMARPGAAQARPAEISGFPAVQITTEGRSAGECEVAVGVADGQSLHVRFSAFQPDAEQPKACEIAEQAAATALAALREKG